MQLCLTQENEIDAAALLMQHAWEIPACIKSQRQMCHYVLGVQLLLAFNLLDLSSCLLSGLLDDLVYSVSDVNDRYHPESSISYKQALAER